jgi:hypothetical protein
VKVFLKQLLFPFSFAIIAFVLIVWLYPLPFTSPYILDLIEYRTARGLFQFDDIDADGNSELLHVGYNRLEDESFPFVRIQKGIQSNSVVLEQINFINPKLTYRPYTAIGDYDSDGHKEFYTFTVRDSILCLEGIEFDTNIINIEPFIKKEIIAINKHENNYDLMISEDVYFIDLNQDRFKECVFVENGLYTASPRGIIAYDIKNDSIWQSEIFGMYLKDIEVLKHNDDYYFAGYSACVHNCEFPLPKYHDYCGWAALFDKHLNLLFPPDSNLHGYPFIVQNYPIIYHDSIHLLSFFETDENSGDFVKARIYNQVGKIVNSTLLDLGGRLHYKFGFTEPSSIYYGKSHTKEGRMLTIGDELHISKISRRKSEILNQVQLSTFEIEGIKIISFFNSNDQTLYLYSEKLHELASIRLPEWLGNYVSSFGEYNGKYCLAISNYFSSMFIEILPNPSFQYRYFYWGLIILGLLGFFMFMQIIFTIQIRRQQKVKETLIRNQLNISKKQLEPHFMLNMLNNIGYLFTKEDNKTAQYYFGKYASLLHRGLKYANQTETSLQEEIQFIEDYLVLQKLRFDGKLEYKINIDNDVYPEDVKIPHSLLYTFVENAIKHGLAAKEADRILEIDISKKRKNIAIEISDNGIGRIRSKELKTSGTGKGMEIVQNIISSYNKLYNQGITFIVKDSIELHGGTKVLIFIRIR